MGYVFLAGVLAALTAMAFVYRLSERRQADRMVMASAMGVAGAVCAVAYILGAGVDLRLAHPSEWVVGAALAFLAVLGAPAFLAAVARGDLSISWMILMLAFAPASVLSVIYPGESVRPLGVVGLVLAAAAVLLLGLDMARRHRSDHPSKPRAGWWLFMSLAFMTNVLSLYAYKLAEALPGRLGAPLSPDASAANVAVLVLVNYAGLAVLAPLVRPLLGARGGIVAGAGIGLLGGALLSLSVFSLIFALRTGLPAYLAFPVTNGGSNVLVAGLSFVFLRERPGVFGWTGLVAGLASFVLIGLAMPRPA